MQFYKSAKKFTSGDYNNIYSGSGKKIRKIRNTVEPYFLDNKSRINIIIVIEFKAAKRYFA